MQVGDGEICAMPLSDDLSRAIGEPKLLFHASEAEWARLVHHRYSGRDGYVTDGPSMWRASLKHMQAVQEKEEAERAEKLEKSKKQVEASNNYYNKDAKPGSLASKANMVARYNEKHNNK